MLFQIIILIYIIDVVLLEPYFNFKLQTELEKKRKKTSMPIEKKEIELSQIFVNHRGDLCIGNNSLVSFDIVPKRTLIMTPEGPIIDICWVQSSLSFYDPPEIIFNYLKRKGYFENENYIEGLYSRHFIYSIFLETIPDD